MTRSILFRLTTTTFLFLVVYFGRLAGLAGLLLGVVCGIALTLKWQSDVAAESAKRGSA